LNRDVKKLRSLKGFGQPETFYDGVEVKETFEKDFKNTDVYHEMELFKDFISKGEEFDEDSGVWREVAQLIGYKNVNSLNTASVKRRFLKRSRELLDILYKKAMKVAKYYFQKKGLSQTNAPGM